MIYPIPTATDEQIHRMSRGQFVSLGLRTVRINANGSNLGEPSLEEPEDFEPPVMIRKNCRECGRFFMANAEAYPCSCRECIGKALYRRDLAKRLKALGVEV